MFNPLFWAQARHPKQLAQSFRKIIGACRINTQKKDTWKSITERLCWLFCESCLSPWIKHWTLYLGSMVYLGQWTGNCSLIWFLLLHLASKTRVKKRTTSDLNFYIWRASQELKRGLHNRKGPMTCHQVWVRLALHRFRKSGSYDPWLLWPQMGVSRAGAGGFGAPGD